jgi:catechol 2,3-dioxygenase-like lactoylglutathione lyase family enzyme
LDPAAVTAETTVTSITAAPTSAVTAAPPAPITVLNLDHIVLRVRDPDASLRFYSQVLGLTPERVEQWRAGTVPFPSVRIGPSVVIDLDGRAAPDGSNLHHFCLEIDITDLDALARRPDLDHRGGPVRRWGARGEADLVYIADPDGNIIELRHYGPSQGFGYHGD